MEVQRTDLLHIIRFLVSLWFNITDGTVRCTLNPFYFFIYKLDGALHPSNIKWFAVQNWTKLRSKFSWFSRNQHGKVYAVGNISKPINFLNKVLTDFACIFDKKSILVAIFAILNVSFALDFL
jgi:hypothetical protein